MKKFVFFLVFIVFLGNSMSQSGDIRIFKLENINSESIEYAPIVTPDGEFLWFVSNRKGSTPTSGGKISHDFWLSRVLDAKKNIYGEAKNLSFIYDNNINTPFNEGVATISFDGKTIYFTACDRPNSVGDCDIFVSYFKEGNWTEPMALSRKINSGYWESHPSLSPDGRTLYFVSNRPGPNGRNNLDIWFSEYDEYDMEWTEAVNLIDINTKGQERAPFIAPDNRTLFFSSDGHKPNLGGLDFYVTRFDDEYRKWLPPANLSAPLNTKKDDEFLSVPASGDLVYFSSNRDDKDNFELYVAHVKSLFKAVVISVTTLDNNGKTVPSEVVIENTYSGRKFVSKTTLKDSTVKFVVSQDDFGLSKDSVKYIDIDVKTKSEELGEKKQTIRIKNPILEHEDEYRDFDSNIDLTTVFLSPGDEDNINLSSKTAIMESNAKIDPYKLDDGTLIPTDTIFYEQVVLESSVPLLNYVFFDHNSSKIPDRYISLDNKSDYFEIKSNRKLEAYHNIMNVIGKRMIDNPKETIRLIGTNSGVDEEKNNKDLSQARANSVRNYLVNTWGINESRIKIETRNLPDKSSNTDDIDGIAENRRVELVSSALLKPITTIDTIYNVFPPFIKISKPSNIIYGDAYWNLKFYQDGNILKSFNGNGTSEESIFWDIATDYPIPQSNSPILIETENNDRKIQKTIVDKDTLILKITNIEDKMKDGKNVEKNEKFSLILFDFGSSVVSNENNSIINTINSRVMKNSIVRVFGYTDRIGDEDINQKISEKRAKNVSTNIKSKNKVIKGFGKSVKLYDNDLPEGRFYSRTVDVIIDNNAE